MTRTEILRLRLLLSALPDSELRDLGLLCVAELLGVRSTLEALSAAISDASKP